MASARKSFPQAARFSKPSPPRIPISAFDFEHFDWGGDYYRRHGLMMPTDGLNALRKHDAILFGSAGARHSDHITLWGLRLKSARPRSVRQHPPHAHSARH